MNEIGQFAASLCNACAKAGNNLSRVNKRKQHNQLDAVDFSVGNAALAQNVGVDNTNRSVKVASVDG